VQSLLIAFGKAGALSPASTAGPKYLTSQAFLSDGFWTGFTQARGLFAQAFSSVFNLFGRTLSTTSTVPTNTTNLIKGF
jgi:hypothetical protein